MDLNREYGGRNNTLHSADSTVFSFVCLCKHSFDIALFASVILFHAMEGLILGTLVVLVSFLLALLITDYISVIKRKRLVLWSVVIGEVLFLLAIVIGNYHI